MHLLVFLPQLSQVVNFLLSFVLLRLLLVVTRPEQLVIDFVVLEIPQSQLPGILHLVIGGKRPLFHIFASEFDLLNLFLINGRFVVLPHLL